MKILKTIIFLGILLIFVKTYSQKDGICGTIEYTQLLDLAYPYSANYKLLFNSEESLYLEQTVKKEAGNIKIEKDGTDTSQKIIVARNNTQANVYYFKNDKFNFREIWFDEPLTVEDNFEFKWILLDETKLLGSFLCKKAKTKYRGRTYYAWYSIQIPYSYGPWKFRGLPGLILEIEEENLKFSITPTKISLDKLKCAIEKPQFDNILTTKEFLAKRDELNNQLLSRISSKSGKGSLPMKMDSDCEGCREFKLEWYDN